jgi:hypothetical protein
MIGVKSPFHSLTLGFVLSSTRKDEPVRVNRDAAKTQFYLLFNNHDALVSAIQEELQAIADQLVRCVGNALNLTVTITK